jgi:hypothetical protein
MHQKEPTAAGGATAGRAAKCMRSLPGMPSDSKRDKTGANYNQTHNDDGKETGRSNIFTHDDTYASIRRSSDEAEPRRPDPRTGSVLTIHKIRLTMLPQDSHPLLAKVWVYHRLVSGCLHRNEKTASSGGSTVTSRTNHETSSRN